MDLVSSLFIFGYAFRQLHRWPSAGSVLLAMLFLGVAVLLLYAIWILVVSAAFWVVKVDNLSYLFGSLFDVARWPISVFSGALRVIFTFVFPVAIMTTFPSLALLGKLTSGDAALAVAGAVAVRQQAQRAAVGQAQAQRSVAVAVRHQAALVRGVGLVHGGNVAEIAVEGEDGILRHFFGRDERRQPGEIRTLVEQRL